MEIRTEEFSKILEAFAGLKKLLIKFENTDPRPPTPKGFH